MESTVKQRLTTYLKEKKISHSEFGRTIGVSAAYVSSIRKSIDKDKLQLIREAYPDLNLDWLLYGEGEMLVSISQGNASNMQIGQNSYNSSKALEMALDEIAEQRKLTTKSQEQIDRLLGIIEGFQNSQK